MIWKNSMLILIKNNWSRTNKIHKYCYYIYYMEINQALLNFKQINHSLNLGKYNTK